MGGYHGRWPSGHVCQYSSSFTEARGGIPVQWGLSGPSTSACTCPTLVAVAGLVCNMSRFTGPASTYVLLDDVVGQFCLLLWFGVSDHCTSCRRQWQLALGFLLCPRRLPL